MTEKKFPTSMVNGDIQPLFDNECTGIIVLSRQENRKTVDNAFFTFIKVAHLWYRISFDGRISISCKIDDPFNPKYDAIENGLSYRKTDVFPLFIGESARIIDIFLTGEQNYKKLTVCFTNGRSIGLVYNIDSMRTFFTMTY